MGSGPEVAENPLALSRAEEQQDLSLVLCCRMLGQDAQHLLGWWVGLDIRAPSQEIAAGRNKVSGLLITPNCGPASLSCSQLYGLVAQKTWYQEKVEYLVDFGLVIGGGNANGPSNPEVDTLSVWVVGDVNIEVESSLLSTRSSQLACLVQASRKDVVWRMGLDECWGLDRCVEILDA